MAAPAPNMPNIINATTRCTQNMYYGSKFVCNGRVTCFAAKRSTTMHCTPSISHSNKNARNVGVICFAAKQLTHHAMYTKYHL